MKILFTLMFSLIVLVSYAQEFYGQPFSPESPMESIAADTEVAVQLKGTIESTCQVKGCWMKISLKDGTNLRVSFKDYGFFVPKSGAEGKETVVNGFLSKKEVSVAQLRHYAEDAGKSQEEIEKINEPKVEYAFVADGVLIK